MCRIHISHLLQDRINHAGHGSQFHINVEVFISVMNLQKNTKKIHGNLQTFAEPEGLEFQF